jgi:anti-sigma factor RsiW
MNDPDTLPADVHQEAALLPWYVNGTLSESDRQQLDRHLATCPACRAELEELARLKSDLRTFYASQPGPSSHAAQRVLATVAREASARRTGHTGQQSWLERVDQWFRMLFLPRWVPTLAAILVVTQVGLVLWLSLPSRKPEVVSSRSVGVQTARFSVVFQTGATEEQIRSLLLLVHGRVIDGPTSGDAYIIEVLAEDESTAQKKREMLRERTDIVRSVDPVKP